MKPFVCYTRPVTEEPKTTSFVQVDEVEATGERKRIFSGWMFAESPASTPWNIRPSTCG